MISQGFVTAGLCRCRAGASRRWPGSLEVFLGRDEPPPRDPAPRTHVLPVGKGGGHRREGEAPPLSPQAPPLGARAPAPAAAALRRPRLFTLYGHGSARGRRADWRGRGRGAASARELTRARGNSLTRVCVRAN